MKKRTKLTFKKLIKIIVGIIVFLSLPTLLLFGFMYFKYNEALPKGTAQGADELALSMLNALDYDAYKATDYIAFTFKNRHHYKWNKTENICEVYWKNYKVILNLNDTSKSEVLQNDFNIEGEDRQELIEKAIRYFNNDSFWLVAPYKVFDKGVIRSVVNLKNNEKALLVTYTSGGVTPGDSYLWQFAQNGKPKSFKMWTSILPIGGLEASWSDWKTTQTGAMLPTFHKLLVLGIEIDTIETKQFNALNVQCIEQKLQEENSVLEPTLLKTCSFKAYTSVAEATSSYTGNYYWSYKLFKKEKDSLIQIKNSELFNTKISALENIINKAFKNQLETNRKNPEYKLCMAQLKFKPYPVDSMGLTFSKPRTINFHLNYNLPPTCNKVNTATYSMNFLDVKPFLKK